jgi:hypothetical protein
VAADRGRTGSGAVGKWVGAGFQDWAEWLPLGPFPFSDFFFFFLFPFLFSFYSLANLI